LYATTCVTDDDYDDKNKNNNYQDDVYIAIICGKAVARVHCGHLNDVCFEGQRRSAKSPTVIVPATKPPSKAGDQPGAGSTATANEQMASDMERNVMLQQQKEHLQAQLVLQQQLHNELQQHLKLQQEHHQLQTQLMVSRCSRASMEFDAGLETAANFKTTRNSLNCF